MNKNPTIVIRSYKDSDHTSVERNLRSERMFHRGHDNRKELGKKTRKLPGSIIVATVDGKVVGSIYSSSDGWFWRLVVDRSYRKLGLGTKLLKAAEIYAKKHNNHSVAFWVDSSKPDLLNYYRRRGYKSSKRVFHYFYKNV